MSLIRWLQWKKRRRHTFVGFLMVATVIGMDYSFMFTTLYLYLRDVVRTQKPGLYYGIIMSTYLVASFIFGALFGRLVDRYRKVRLFTNITLVLQIIGILLYIVPSGIVYPMVGRLVSGIGDPYTTVCSGELVRVYDIEDATWCLWWLSACYSFGFTIGPIFVIFFRNVNFDIGHLHFDQLNSVGLLLAGVLVFVLVVVNFLIYDCSAMMDLNFSLSEADKLTGRQTPIQTRPLNDNLSEQLSEETTLLNPSVRPRCYSKDRKGIRDSQGSLFGLDTEYSVSINYSWSPRHSLMGDDSVKHQSERYIGSVRLVLTDLLTHGDALLMFVSTFVFVFSLFAIDVLIPLLTGLILDWSLTAISLIFAANGLSYVVMVMVSSKLCVTDRSVYHMTLVSIISIILLFVIVIILHFMQNHRTASIFLVTIFVVLLALGWFVEEVLIRCTLAKMVPQSQQNLVEALRHGVSQSGMILAAITIPMYLHYFKWWCSGVIVTNLLLLCVFISRRNSLILVREIEFPKNIRNTDSNNNKDIDKDISLSIGDGLSVTL